MNILVNNAAVLRDGPLAKKEGGRTRKLPTGGRCADIGPARGRTRNSLIAGTPSQRIGTPYEMWLAIRVIIECDYFTGRVIEVDGG